MRKVEVRVYSADAYDADWVQVIFEVTNTGDEDVYVLKRNTPLEGLRSDCLIVKRGRTKIPYDGIHVKRLPPSTEELVHLAPGAHLSSKVDVSQAYDLSKKGSVSVDFDARKLVVLGPPDATRAFIDTMALARSALRVKVASNKATLKVTSRKRLTMGERHRVVQKKSGMLMAFTAGPRAAVLMDDKPGDRTKVTKAHKDGYKLTEEAFQALKNDPRYLEWFGKHTDARFKRVKKSYGKIRDRMEDLEFTYVCRGGDECDSSTFAYTTIGGDTIWLCPAFWRAPAVGTNSKAGTMVHEHSHASAGTDDMDYSPGPCRELARKKPGQAIRNADNYEYYAGG